MFAFAGWHLLVLVGLVLVPLVLVGGVVAIVVVAVRSRSRNGPVHARPEVAARLRELDALRAGGVITEAEFEARRRRIPDEI